MSNINIDLIYNVTEFLHDNEQYGDNWSEEIDAIHQLLDSYIEKIADEVQEFMLSADDDTVEDFCGFPLVGITKEDAVYQVMCQMPDDILLEYYEKFIG